MSDKPKGKAKGGVARAKALSPRRRSEIARKGARARWGQIPLRATHKGNFEEEFGFDVECYVLDDDQRTAVISQRGMSSALGISESSGRALPRFLSGEKIAPYVGAELGEKLSNPLVFQWFSPVLNQPEVTVYGYDVTILIDICKAIIQADDEGALLRRQKHFARQARIIVAASAKAGIKGLVYALAGYDAAKEEVIAAWKYFVRQEAREYEKEFPDELYDQWYRLYKLPRPERNKPWKFRLLTLNHIYVPLARSNGKILELTRVQRAASKDRRAKLHQFLSSVGVKALRTHLGQVLGMAQVSEDEHAYELNIAKVFGDQHLLDFSQD